MLGSATVYSAKMTRVYQPDAECLRTFGNFLLLACIDWWYCLETRWQVSAYAVIKVDFLISTCGDLFRTFAYANPSR